MRSLESARKQSAKPKFLEKKLKRKYGANSKIPYKVMNKIGAMRGNKETSKQQADMKKYTGSVSGYKHSRAVRKVVKRRFGNA